MIIGPGDERLKPGMVSFWSDAMFDRKPLDEFRGQRGEEFCVQVIDRFCARTILYLERVAEQHCFFDVFDPEGTLTSVRPVLRAHQGMSHEIDETVSERVSVLLRNL